MKKLIIKSNIVSDDLASFRWNFDLNTENKKYNTVEEAKDLPLAKEMFYLPFIKSVSISKNEMLLERFDIVSWKDVLDEVEGSGWNHPGQGSTTSKDKSTGTLDREHPHRATSIDLNKWIMDNFNKEDFIHVKLDIEGGEYDVLPNMIKGGSIDYIDEFDIEFHSHKIGLDEKVHNDLLNELRVATKGRNINVRTH